MKHDLAVRHIDELEANWPRPTSASPQLHQESTDLQNVDMLFLLPFVAQQSFPQPHEPGIGCEEGFWSIFPRRPNLYITPTGGDMPHQPTEMLFLIPWWHSRHHGIHLVCRGPCDIIVLHPFGCLLKCREDGILQGQVFEAYRPRAPLQHGLLQPTGIRQAPLPRVLSLTLRIKRQRAILTLMHLVVQKPSMPRAGGFVKLLMQIHTVMDKALPLFSFSTEAAMWITRHKDSFSLVQILCFLSAPQMWVPRVLQARKPMAQERIFASCNGPLCHRIALPNLHLLIPVERCQSPRAVTWPQSFWACHFSPGAKNDRPSPCRWEGLTLRCPMAHRQLGSFLKAIQLLFALCWKTPTAGSESPCPMEAGSRPLQARTPWSKENSFQQTFHQTKGSTCHHEHMTPLDVCNSTGPNTSEHHNSDCMDTSRNFSCSQKGCHKLRRSPPWPDLREPSLHPSWTSWR